MSANHTGMLARVLEALKDVDVTPSTKAPLLQRLAWRKGIMIPPPILASFWFNVLFLGIYFGVMWGLAMALFYVFIMPSSPRMVLAILPVVALLAGALFGLFMAIYARVQARRYDLPSWQSLVDAERSGR
jgi:hypothetical protein